MGSIKALTMAGMVVESGKFDWGSPLSAPKFPDMLQPSAAYHGVAACDRTLEAQFTQAVSTARHHPGPGRLDHGHEPEVDAVLRALVADE